MTAPTETEQGYTTHTCKHCGDSYVDSYTDPVPGATEPEVPETTAPSGDNGPDTGDNAMVGMWMALLLFCVSGVTLLVTFRRKWLKA